MSVTEPSLVDTGPPVGAAAEPVPDTPVRKPLARFWRRFRRQKAGLVAAGFLLFVVFIAVFGPVLAPHDPNAQNLSLYLSDPFTPGHVLGTDELGRDVLSRMMYSARVSLLAATLAVSIGFAIGVPLGLVAGFVSGKLDGLIMRLTDAVMAFPPLILAIAVIGALGPSLVNAMIAVGVIFAPRFIRLVRSSVLSVREETFIEASRSMGTPAGWIITRHVLPNSLSPLIVQVSLAAGFSLLAEAGLSFLGLGVQPPDASWGTMLGRGFRVGGEQPWLVVWPGLAIAASVLAFNVLGDAIRDSLGREIRTGDR